MKNKVLYIVLIAITTVFIELKGAQVPLQNNEFAEISPEGAWCWFADPRALHYENADKGIDRTYIGYIDVHGNIKATQIDWKNNKSEEVLIRSYFQPDDHDNPTFLALPDGRVMVFYSRHTDEPCFYYRVSHEPGDITTLGDEKVLRTKDNTTYPSPFILSDDPEHIYLCWRGINWHPTIGRMMIPDDDGNTNFDWGPYQMVQSTGARPYAKYASNGKDKLYFAYTTGHPDNEDPNYVYFNEVDVKGLYLKDINGKVLSRIQDGPYLVDKSMEFVKANPSVVVDHSGYRDWIWELSMQSDEHPVIAMVQISGDKKDHDYYWVTWDGNEWKKTFLADAGGHFHNSPEIEKCYSGGMTIDKKNPRVVYGSVPVEGKHGKVYEIVKYTVNPDGTVSRDAITKNSIIDNARPFSIPGAQEQEKPVSLAWMNGDYYDWIVSKDRPQGYATAIYANGPMPVSKTKLPKTVAKGTLDASQSAKLDVNNNGDFTINMKLSDVGRNLPGSRWEFGNFSYGVDRLTLKPYVFVDGSLYESTNMIATSDGWTKYIRATDGKWCAPEIPGEVEICLTYQDGVLRTYIDGLLDQNIKVQGLETNGIESVSNPGLMTEYGIYPAALNQDQIKALVNK